MAKKQIKKCRRTPWEYTNTAKFSLYVSPYLVANIEERNNVWNTPYLFNAKEFDEETGMYYYGADTLVIKVSLGILLYT